jgi:hypothetical protein
MISPTSKRKAVGLIAAHPAYIRSNMGFKK